MTAVLLALAGLLAGAGTATAADGAGRGGTQDLIKVYVVRSPAQNGGRPETLGEVARRTLRSDRRAAEVLDLNRGRVQPDGGVLVDPDRLTPGWILRLPADASGPDVRLGRLTGGSAAAAPPPPAPPRVVRVPVALAVLAGVLLALLTVTLLARRTVGDRVRAGAAAARRAGGVLLRPARRHAVRRRRHELAVRWRADPGAPSRAAATAATADVGRDGADPPGVVALRDAPTRVTVWTGAPAAPPPPWREDTPTRWSTDGPAAAPGLAPRPVAPRLVRVGEADGDVVLVDLEHCDGALVVAGHPATAAETVAALVVELAAVRPELEVLVVGSRAPAGARDAQVVDVAGVAARVGRAAPPVALPAGAGALRAGARRRPLRGVVVVMPGAVGRWDELAPLCRRDGGWLALVAGDVPGGHWRWHADPERGVRIDVLDVEVLTPR